MGTAHLLDALRGVSQARVAVMVTTDKVYRNREWPYPYREDDALGGHDPYSASKAASEIVIASYRDAFLAAQGVAIASARAGNVIGGGDWSEDRLLPDAMRAWQSGQALEIRKPEAIRPWQHVLDPLSGYLTRRRPCGLGRLAGAYNFGPPSGEAATVRQVVELARAPGRSEVVFGDGGTGPHEAGWLSLEVAKARAALGALAHQPEPGRCGHKSAGTARSTRAPMHAPVRGADCRVRGLAVKRLALLAAAFARTDAGRAPAAGRCARLPVATVLRTGVAGGRLTKPIAQVNHSYTARSGTVRGMHYQRAPHCEMKLVSVCAARSGMWRWTCVPDRPAFCSGTPSVCRRTMAARC
jgi:hypothetical protein